MNNLEKPLVEFSKSKEYQRCSNFMLDGPPVEKWDILMNVDLIKGKVQVYVRLNFHQII
jgi:hypothetical protein